MKYIIAIDGTSASGKGTLSKFLAQKLNFNYLDTGLMYRYVGYMAKERNILNNKDDIIQMTPHLDFKDISSILELKSDEIAMISSTIIAPIQEIRDILIAKQRYFGENPQQYNKESNGSVIDGRDIGTRVFPNANLKFFITASIQERANRRFKELQSSNSSITYEEIFSSLQKRDTQDTQSGNFYKAEDAIIIDTTTLNIELSCNLIYTTTMEKLQL